LAHKKTIAVRYAQPAQSLFAPVYIPQAQVSSSALRAVLPVLRAILNALKAGDFSVLLKSLIRLEWLNSFDALVLLTAGFSHLMVR